MDAFRAAQSSLVDAFRSVKRETVTSRYSVKQFLNEVTAITVTAYSSTVAEEMFEEQEVTVTRGLSAEAVERNVGHYDDEGHDAGGPIRGGGKNTDRRERRSDQHPLIRTEQDDRKGVRVWVKDNLPLKPSSLLEKKVAYDVGRAMVSGKVEDYRAQGRWGDWRFAVGGVLAKAANYYFRGFTGSAIPARHYYYFEGGEDLEPLRGIAWATQLHNVPYPVRCCLRLAMKLDDINNELEDMEDQDKDDVFYHAVYNFDKSMKMLRKRCLQNA